MAPVFYVNLHHRFSKLSQMLCQVTTAGEDFQKTHACHRVGLGLKQSEGTDEGAGQQLSLGLAVSYEVVP